MSDQLIKAWEHARRTRKEAEKWQALSNDVSRQGGNFAISKGHSHAPMICRAGQHTAGGKNYWETERGFNSAILSYLCNNWDEVYPRVLEILKRKEAEALFACQGYISEMQKTIDAAKQEPL